MRELQLVSPARPAEADHHHPTTPATGSLLAAVQAGVREDVPSPGPPLPDRPDERLELGEDRSIQVHACHGRARQVEVLRDAILHQLAEDPSLEPRDVIVMCPDIETFAPLIGATFGAGEVSPDDDELDALPDELRPPDLRVRLADRSLRQTNAVLGFVSRLLELADQRLTASQVLDLADREPVRRRFGLDDDDVARVEEWVAQSGIRWGLDAAHRAPFKLDKLPAGTWRAGLDRVLLGVAMTDEEQRLFGGVLPLDDVESGAIDLAGRFAELIDRLQACVDGMRRPMTVGGWTAAIAAAADALTDASPRDAWQRAELQRLLDDVEREAAVAGASATALALAEVRALLAERLEGRPTRTNFRTGHLTICTLVPMRSVPHRVVCLLGLDDGEFPRKSVRDGDDLVLRDPHVGDRDSRTEDRQMLLDALMAATDRLIVTYTGKDERTNTPRPPAVPVGELLDVIDATARVAGRLASARPRARPAPAAAVRPAQLHARRARAGPPLGLRPRDAAGRPRARRAAHRAAAVPRRPAARGRRAAGGARRPRPLRRTPVRAFLRQRLGIMLGDFDDEVGDALTVELDHLEQWGVGTRLLEGRLAGADMDACVAAEVARGLLPPGRLGTPVIERLRPTVEELAGYALRLGDGASRSADVKLALADGRILSGTVPGIHGDLLRVVQYSRVAPKHRIALWVRWLALSAAHPERAIQAVLMGRARPGAHGPVTICRLPAVGAEAARWRSSTCCSTSTAAACASRCRSPAPPRRPTRAGRGPGAQGVGVGLELPQGGRRARAPARVRRRAELRRAARARRCARARTSSRRSRPASGACRGGCGAGCCPSRSWRRDEHARSTSAARCRPA